MSLFPLVGKVSPDMSHAERLNRYATVSTSLALLSDRRLAALVADATPIGAGIGGTSAALDIGGVPVFVKRIPLTDLETRQENVLSTANLYGVPTCCQYGVVGPGFGAWRELAANVMTTNWVLTQDCVNFPLMYHWRVLPGHTPLSDEHADIDRVVAYWHGSSGVRARLAALSRSAATVVLFLEHLPHNLHEWLTEQVAAGGDAVESACAMVERDLTASVRFMNSRGLLHFDAHFRNILTDGRRLYLADLGLATSPRFELSPAERDFVDENAEHDAAHTVTQLVDWLVTALCHPADPLARNDLIRRVAEGADPGISPPSAASIIRRYAPIAVVVNEFYRRLHVVSRTTPYPAEAVRRVLGSGRY